MNEKKEKDLAISSEKIVDYTTSVEVARAMKQVEAQILCAKKYPRDTVSAYQQIIETCKRPSFANNALYLYPRGGQSVTGPSIRMAEAMARAWGNLEYGLVELEQGDDFSIIQSYCYDLQSNVRQVKTFKVPHYRHTRQGKKRLTDPRDIYENNANNGARRLRACILGAIPADIIQDAVDECYKTQSSTDSKEPIADRIKKMILFLHERFSISKEMVEKKYGMDAEQLTNVELLELKNICLSLKDGMSQRKDWFDFGKTQSEKTDKLNDTFKPKED